MKKTIQTAKKLSLDAHTLRRLQANELAGVAGGDYTCGGTMCGSCSYKSAQSKCPPPHAL